MRSFAIFSSPETKRRRLDARIAAFERSPWGYSIRIGLLMAVAIGVVIAVVGSRFGLFLAVDLIVLIPLEVVGLRYWAGPRMRRRRDKLFPETPDEHQTS